MFPKLSRRELAKTLCEHLDWRRPNGSYKLESCLRMLEELEGYGLVTLPAKRVIKAPVRRKPGFKETPDETPIETPLKQLLPIVLQIVDNEEDRALFNAYIDRYHYLGYRQPVGSHLRYFIVSGATGHKLGCLLFSASATWALAPRDEWVGWEKKHKRKLLNLIVDNTRFLIFPWVHVTNLASLALSLAAKHLGDDWVKAYGYRPVLLETYIDPTKYLGTAYQAANWIYLGKTQGRGFDPKHENKKTRKDIYVYPLNPDWRRSLTGGHQAEALKKRYRNDVKASHTLQVEDSFVMLWEKVVHIIQEVAEAADEQWRVRKRVINSMLIILLIFRLVTSKNSQGYGTTIDELWDNCKRLNIPLAQKGVIASSSFCVARKKMDERVFKQINQRILDEYADYRQKSDARQASDSRWFGHRLFAVDGSKINLPRPLVKNGYPLPSYKANYPQGLVSCLYNLKTWLPVDFDLVAHANERSCALKHLQALEKGDIVVYDRGYFSYMLLYRHQKIGIHAVFRLKKSNFSVINDFFESPETDIITKVELVGKSRRKILAEYPDFNFIPLPIRLIKYTINGNPYCLGTTLLDQQRYPAEAFKDVYHERWGIEELYKVSKNILDVTDFHARSERGVKQELFAHFVLITMNRLFANQSDSQLNSLDTSTAFITETPEKGPPTTIRARIRTNFKNCIRFVTKSLEDLLLWHTRLKDAVANIFQIISSRYQKERPGRSYERKSMKPVKKWQPQPERGMKRMKTLPS
ncbi:MAG: IS4 family transposase [Deltaproteobacteria bacterium]|nr:IS4 family transposase [Deltaproteobacteria bacterium]